MTENEYKYIKDNIDIINKKIDIVLELLYSYSRGRERLLRERGGEFFLSDSGSGCGYVDNSVNNVDNSDNNQQNKPKMAYSDLDHTIIADSLENANTKHFRAIKTDIKEIYLGSGEVVFSNIELVNGKANICKDQIDNWIDIYKSIDVVLEIKKAIEWLKANPSRNKSVRGFYKYLNGWLMRANDRNHYYSLNKQTNNIKNSLQDNNDSWEEQFNTKEAK